LDSLPDILVIKAIWTIIVGSKDSSEKNPILMRLFSRLPDIHSEKGFTEEELAMLYQIKIHCDRQVKAKTWPKEFGAFISNDLTNVAQDAFSNLYETHRKSYASQDLQKEIATSLLQLRVSFVENVGAEYKSDFKIVG
jgi:hypothetical protein